jgi:hypothetical protein
MAWYRVRLRLTPAAPPTTEQLAQLTQAGVLIWRRGEDLSASVTTDGSDPAGAIIRAQNAILDVLPSEVQRGTFEVVEPPDRTRKRSRRHRK